MPRLVMIAALLLSALIHAGPIALRYISAAAPVEVPVVAVGLVPDVRAPEARPAPGVPVVRRSDEAIQRDREALIAEARAARGAERLALGDFLLRAAALDAEELGYLVDIAEARRRYEAGLAGVKERLASGEDIVSLLREAYGGLHYQSIGGSMADALLDGGGSCEQLTHLFAATMHDAGLAQQSFVSYWGGGSGHLAPIYRYGERDYDVVAGWEAAPGGVRVPAAELVEIYARAHGLAAGPSDGSDGASHAWSDGRASFAGGYPPNDDPHAGALPIFSARALGAGVGATADEPREQEGSDRCFVWPHDDWWRQTIAIVPPASDDAAPYEIEWRPLPTEGELAYRAYEIANTESRLQVRPPLRRMLLQACLAVAYEDLAIDFSLSRMHSLSRVSLARAEAMRTQAAGIGVPIASNEAALVELRKQDDLWTLAHVPGAEALVVRLVEGVRYVPPYAGETNAGIPQLIAASLRRDALARAVLPALERLQPLDQYIIASQIMMLPGVGDAVRRVAPDSDLARGLAALERMFAGLVAESGSAKAARDPMEMMRNAGFPPRWLEAMEQAQREAR